MIDRKDNHIAVESKPNPVEDLNKKVVMKEIEREFLNIGYDSDDVFANNPSSVMLHRVKVIRKFLPVEEKVKEIVKIDLN